LQIGWLHCVATSKFTTYYCCSSIGLLIAVDGTCFGRVENKATIVTKPRIFEIALQAKEIGFEGYENPNQAQTAKTMNIAPRAYNENFVI
jgi:hypothetical protein